MDTHSKDWVNYLTALLTPTIVVFGSIIAFLQWRTNRNRLKHELFDRRYAQFKAVSDYIGSILSHGTVKADDELRLLSHTRGMEFLFDEDVCQLVREIRSTVSLLTALNDELASVGSDNRKSVAQARADAFKKLTEYSRRLESRFAPYLTLKH